MKISFVKINIENFLSFGSAEVDFRNRGFTLVSGVNKNPSDNAKSNGSGKSALWDAIAWVLTGTTIRGLTKDIVNIHTEGGCKVELSFILDGKNYRIIRSREHKELGSNLKIYINNEDKSGKGIRDSEKLLAEYIPDLTSSLIGSVIILGQGLPQRFSNNTPSGRKEVLEKLSKSDFMIEDIKNRLNQRKSELNNDLRTYQDASLKGSSEKGVLESQLSSLKEKLSEMSSSTTIDDNIAQFTRNVEQLDSEVSRLSDIKAQLEPEYSRALADGSSLKVEAKVAEDAVQANYKQSLDDLTTAKNNALFAVNAKKAEIEKAKNIKDICPTCGQKLPQVHKPNLEPLEAELKELTGALDLAQRNYETLYNEMLVRLKEVSNKYKERIVESANRCDQLYTKWSEVSTQLSTTSTQLGSAKTSLSVEIEKRRSFDARKLEVEQSTESTTARIESVDKDILYNKEMEELVAQHLEVVNKMITIATRDFRGHLLTNVISYIDKKAKEYALDVFGTDKISFALNGNNIDISYDEKTYESLSGGEKQRVDIIVQFALRDMLCQFNSFYCNVLVLDELFDNLDAVGCDNILNLITKKLTDVESVFIITHHSDIAVPADSFITIVKDERGISSVANL